MTKELHRAFNEEVHRYKNALDYCAKQCDWATFKLNAGRLFDYLESIERSEIERRFFRVFGIIMAVLFLAAVFFFRVPESYPELLRIKKIAILTSLAGCGFEFYFFVNFRLYMENKMTYYHRRRERFIRNIEQDFRETRACSGG